MPVEYKIYPTTINGIDPTMIRLKSLLLFLISNKSFLKKKIIVNKEPRWRLISINNELDLNSYKLETKIRCAEELIGKNSDIPCIAESIKTSIIFWYIQSS